MEQMTQLFKALSEEMRLRILMLLMHGELCVCDLMAIFNEPQSKVSRHLAYLKNSGLIKGRRVGKWMHYALKEPMDGVFQAQLDLIKTQLTHNPLFEEDLKKMEEEKKKKDRCGEDSAITKEDKNHGKRTDK
ncbi:MAG TPA: metalloregulator ArsR/SmtB family transcription factor [Syntrophorhabdaceae bacterium]|nr:metalloregulator ArsR/SmtB family transcription factor [Syntrophorhabdaceae bacterium]HPU29718.1 metalloregulator ArsR/SmtB family transcription factor [Syntrophorhabdaceae bacterium]